MVYVFISYATPDRGIADEVAGWLRSDGHEPFLAHDLRNGVGAGEDWKQRLYDELHEADVVIGVVTSSFVASNWCSSARSPQWSLPFDSLDPSVDRTRLSGAIGRRRRPGW